MRDPVSREAGGDGVLGAAGEAAARLDQAISRLETGLAEGRGTVASDRDRDRLSEELKAARAREEALEAAAAAASQALGRAAAAVRAALETGEASDPEPMSDLDETTDPAKANEPAKALGEEEAA